MNNSQASEETILEQALGFASPEARAAYLQDACGNDLGLRGRLEALIEAHHAAGGFLAENPGTGAATAADHLRAQESPGTIIGRYKLLEKLGEGGCGVVYMAEQEAPVRRRVALKVIKLGMDTRSVIARFEAERQALALMDHPNIAKVLEAGATDTGRPYFVMELVGGIKITDYCEQKNLTTHQRLDLFIQVCRAVQHAHQKGIIHRDIKPSNVLVAEQDGVAVPKVIDFGIAKATQGKLTDETVFTAFEQFLGTPAYMSPEQAQLGGLDVDTRSDIYSLGVLLYELLTGKTPFDTKELLAAGLDAMRRTIQEKEPPTPSTRLKQELSSKSEIRTPNSELKSALRTPHSAVDRDLDWIVMKCLEKDRGRRYETANGLARDIERHLNNEPVVAGPPSNLYRFQKFVHRNKVLFAAAGAVGLALIVGLGSSTLLFFRERAGRREQERLRQQAQTEAAKSQQVAKFLKDMLGGVGPSRALGRDTTMLREILDKTVERVGRELANQPEVEADLELSLAEAYYDLGDFKKAEAMYRMALPILRQQLGQEHEKIASTLHNLASVLYGEGRLAEAEPMLREELAMCRKMMGKAAAGIAPTLNSLANVLHAQGKLAEAEATYREALELQRKLTGDEDRGVAIARANVAMVLSEQGKNGEAEAMMRAALATLRKLLGDEHPDVSGTLHDLGIVLRGAHKLKEAEAAFRQTLVLRRKVLGNEHLDVARSLGFLGAVLSDQNNFAEAEDVMRETLRLQQKLVGNDNPDLQQDFYNLFQVLKRQNKLAEAESICEEQLAGLRARLSADDPQLAAVLSRLVSALMGQGKFAEAETAARECLTIREKSLHSDWRVHSARTLLGQSLLGQKKYAEAESFLVAGYDALKRLESTIAVKDKNYLKEVLESLMQLFAATGRPDQAAQWKQKLDEFERSRTNQVPTR
jgi:serine/threonine protein kinase/tetratricopeptide (TPR) repeat protein